ncbi:MAG: hypothetical protein GEU74_03890 [Nitriliruptorales bacterium]|nr:hypothetical protein [Nitriliruptorales bacterium]
MTAKRAKRPPAASVDLNAETLAEVWAHCASCGYWFRVADPSLDALFLCPVDLHKADEAEVRLPE